MKTSFMYFIRDGLARDPGFIEKNKADICASIQKTIIDYLTGKLLEALRLYPVRDVAIAGGVAANTGLRKRMQEICSEQDYRLHIPKFEYCTDNAAMIAIAGYYKFLKGDITDQSIASTARMSL
jgi:N6-L-threonylcarbamoyladenine synthase